MLLDMTLGIIEAGGCEHLLMNRGPVLVKSRVPVPEGVWSELYNNAVGCPYKIACKPSQLLNIVVVEWSSMRVLKRITYRERAVGHPAGRGASIVILVSGCRITICNEGRCRGETELIY